MMVGLHVTTVYVHHVLQYRCAPEFITVCNVHVGPHKYLNVHNRVTSQQTFLHQHKVKYLHSYDTENFLTAKLVSDSKMFDKSYGFPDSAEAPSQRDFCAMMYYDYCQGKSFQQCFQSLSNCFGYILRRDPQFTSGTRIFGSTERCLKTVTVVTDL